MRALLPVRVRGTMVAYPAPPPSGVHMRARCSHSRALARRECECACPCASQSHNTFENTVDKSPKKSSVSQSRDVCLASGRLAHCIEKATLPAIVSLGPEADETELDTTATHHVLALGNMLDEHATLRAGTAARCFHPNNVFLLGFSKDAQAMIFVTALLVSTLGGPGISPLVETMPAEIETTALLLGAKATGQTFVFGIDSFAEALTTRTFLDPHCLLQVVFGNPCLELFLFVFR